LNGWCAAIREVLAGCSGQQIFNIIAQLCTRRARARLTKEGGRAQPWLTCTNETGWLIEFEPLAIERGRRLQAFPWQLSTHLEGAKSAGRRRRELDAMIALVALNAGPGRKGLPQTA